MRLGGPLNQIVTVFIHKYNVIMPRPNVTSWRYLIRETDYQDVGCFIRKIGIIGWRPHLGLALPLRNPASATATLERTFKSVMRHFPRGKQNSTEQPRFKFHLHYFPQTLART